MKPKVYKKAAVRQTSQSFVEVSSDNGASEGKKYFLTLKCLTKNAQTPFFQIVLFLALVLTGLIWSTKGGRFYLRYDTLTRYDTLWHIFEKFFLRYEISIYKYTKNSFYAMRLLKKFYLRYEVSKLLSTL